ncbi:MAG: hypothetical protein A3F33_03590 [Candidatus Woykebacteria bacterium RIFCSPHIGHO2_12_FULL_43_10]|uniref:ATP-grasp domain-containing protein n=2 Tax=Candidatus Woykeibacteriota TaxID=1817899 RepID=A0A1G1WVG4_9BACT|nr:MAG: hypothetical protein A3J50_03300 [Candidatus Woykebacteria bacterium RIFCSPHIGHO2_02_FULL_43_16b]OGY30217.1 MAG: hypothetical protein A3F33_03590 [Candidatus Woykebacteria bacterium RIFCSPHIGHO2_12_FULL_43_10]OGY31758.1 MAG: hypothetical protein A3A61_02030 [Candidatus Woykebacteria bacterium RIFCSPLOWO2_01_FULL_43_14]
MILYEFEGKELLRNGEINTPSSLLVDNQATIVNLHYPLMAKAQVLSGKRAQAGGIVSVEEEIDLEKVLNTLLGSTINNETVEKVLVEEKVDVLEEYYVSLSYDTSVRGPVLTLSENGGSGIEERKSLMYPINPVAPSKSIQAIKTVPIELLEKLISVFFQEDCLLLEVNPLVKTKSSWVALDAKINLDECAAKNHPEWAFKPRGVPGYSPTPSEIEAKKIDEGDYRGVAGSTYFDLDGDIAILASGGGASLTALDSLLKLGGKPANYTEYGGNPSGEKVARLTKIVLSKPGLKGLWIVGAIANFTDIYETLSGIIEGLRVTRSELGLKLDFPIVIRRGGPRDKEAFEMLRKVKDFDLYLYGEETSITESAKVIIEKTSAYVPT